MGLIASDPQVVSVGISPTETDPRSFIGSDLTAFRLASQDLLNSIHRCFRPGVQ